VSTPDTKKRDVGAAGLCALCSFQRVLVSGRGSTFSLCEHPGLPKYPRLPVLRCSDFEREGVD
jgi:hypothetical protein